MIRLLLLCITLLAATGCGILPRVSRQPVIQNPFPQLSRVAVAPFFNQSDEKTVDGRKFAIAYYNELQATPGFEVVPVTVVEEAMLRYQIGLNSPEQARQLAQILGVDAVVIGTVTDFTPYYPPRCGIQVEWWAANPGFHPIPAGYGLPWGQPEEEFIPGNLVYQAEMELAREQLATQTPHCPIPLTPPANTAPPAPQPELIPVPEGAEVTPAGHKAAVAPANAPAAAPLPPGWPDPRGFVPPGPAPVPPPCVPSSAPVLRHVNIYHGNDELFIESIQNYAYFQQDLRYGGWQSYLERSDEFIRFCCYLHIAEMLTARGGAAESKVVWRWPDNR